MNLTLFLCFTTIYYNN